jgi:hypothetical protein
MSKSTIKDQIRSQAEASLVSFIRLVHPRRVLGSVHVDVIGWWTREDAKSHQLLLLPRDHGKSAMVAYRVAWEITRNPAVRILYLSATARLAEKQLKFIKDILTSPKYLEYWPNMINPDESKREKWTESEISVDHPSRKDWNVRDPTVFTAGLTTTITGMHCDIAVLDDIVVKENAYTEDGRNKVREQYSLLSSIAGTDAREWIVGTRYHPRDLYGDLVEIEYEEFDEDGEVIASHPLYEKFERQVEDRGDGTGQFLWPRQMGDGGKYFGFDQQILSKKRAAYEKLGQGTQFRAQYYNDPNSTEGSGISREYFQYYEPKNLQRQSGKWYIKNRRLNVFAAIDFAYSLRKKADYSCIVVVGIDQYRNYYVLDIDRFQTDKIGDYFSRIMAAHTKWDFRKISAEVTAAQAAIVNALKYDYIKPYGLALAVEEHKPNRHDGTKEERIYATLQPRYQNMQMWHYRGGNCQMLEEELELTNPGHDDIKDALTSAVNIAVAPSSGAMAMTREFVQNVSHSRFGGIA